MSKRAHKTLTIDQKIEVLDQLPTKSYTIICKEFGIGRSTITDIKKREPVIRAYNDRGYQHLSDDDIITNVINKSIKVFPLIHVIQMMK